MPMRRTDPMLLTGKALGGVSEREDRRGHGSGGIGTFWAGRSQFLQNDRGRLGLASRLPTPPAPAQQEEGDGQSRKHHPE